MDKRLNMLKYYKPGWLSMFITSLVVVIITFPFVSPVYSNGIDPPLAWVFNYLVHGRMSLGKDIFFPHGPLAFLMYPLDVGNNLIITLFVYLVTRVYFAYSFIRLSKDGGVAKHLICVVASLILLALLDFLLVITGIVLLGYLQYLRKGSWADMVIPLLLTAFSLYIKAFVGIVCFITTVIFFLMLAGEVIFEKRPLRSLLYILILPLAIILLWYSFYSTGAGLWHYFAGMKELAGDNSTAVAYYPENNWWWLGLAGAFLTVLTILQWKEKESRYLILLSSVPLFTVWKYGMAREDYLHAGMWFLFVVMTGLILLAVIRRKQGVSALLIAAIFGLSYLNLRNAYYFEPPRLNFNGIHNLSGYLFHYKYIADTSGQASLKNIERNKISPSLRALIGEATTDIYPWDYSYIPANSLNWQPRPVLQSYACYTSWLDRENAWHFTSGKAPGFLIWEMRKITHDIHNGTMEGIDGRYLLNDQPQTIMSILSHYQLKGKQTGTFPALILGRRSVSLNPVFQNLGRENTTWNHWIKVPAAQHAILRLRAKMDRNVAGDLKSLLYKDEAVYMYYLMDNEDILLYRIVPRNANDGLWINPMIIDSEEGNLTGKVKEVMFRCSNVSLMKRDISLEWEAVKFSLEKEILDGDSLVNRFFGKGNIQKQHTLVSITNDLERKYEGFTENPAPVKGEYCYSAPTCCRVGGENYSFSYELDLDSLLKVNTDSVYQVDACIWAFSPHPVNSSLVISVESGSGPLLWKGNRINDFLIDKHEWNYVINFLEFSKKDIEGKRCRLKVYVWNQGKSEILVDNMRVVIKSR